MDLTRIACTASVGGLVAVAAGLLFHSSQAAAVCAVVQCLAYVMLWIVSSGVPQADPVPVGVRRLSADQLAHLTAALALDDLSLRER